MSSVHGKVLMDAVERGDEEACKDLIRKGVQVNWARPDGCTPLHVAVMHENGKLCDILIKSGVSLDAANKEGKTALCIASARGIHATVSKLLSFGANPDIPGNDGRSAMHFVAMAGHEETMQLLIQKKGNVNAQQNSGVAPLHWAVLKRHHLVVGLLLKQKGINVDVANNDGATPLHWAAKQGDRALVQALIKAGANRELLDKSGRTPVELAKERGFTEDELFGDQPRTPVKKEASKVSGRKKSAKGRPKSEGNSADNDSGMVPLARFENMQMLYQTSNEKHQLLEKENEKLRKDFEKASRLAEKEIGNLKSEVSQLRKSNNNDTAKMKAEFEKAMSEKERAHEKAREDATRNFNDLQTLYNQTFERLNNSLQDSEKLKESHVKTLEEHEKSHIEKVSVAKKEAEKLAQESRARSEKLAAAENDITTKKVENQNLMQKLEQIIDTAKLESEAAKRDLTSKESEILQLREKLKEECDMHAVCRDRLNVSNLQIKEHLDTIKELQDSYGELQSQHNLLKSQNNDTTKALQVALTDKESIQLSSAEESLSLQAKISDRDREIIFIQNEFAVLSKSHEELQLSHKNTVEENRTQQARILELEKQVSEHEASLLAMGSANKTEMENLKNLQDSFSAYSEKVQAESKSFIAATNQERERRHQTLQQIQDLVVSLRGDSDNSADLQEAVQTK